MQITVLVEPMNGKGFRVSGGEPFRISVDGETREEALSKLQNEIQSRLNGGAEVVTLDVAAEPNPWLKIAGIYKDDPMLEEWKQAMEDYRDHVEKDDDYR